MQQSPLAFHGNTNSVQQVDGIRYNNMEGAGQYSGMYWNDGMIQEIQYTTSGDSAETQAGGVRINMIPKEGGNAFRGTVFGNFTYDKWHSNNLDQRLIDRGLQSVGKIQEIWDFNPSIGGPILRDRLWFHYSMRNWGVNRTVPGSFSEIELDRPSIDDSYINSNVLRMTWQINNTHKLGAHYDRNHKYRGHWGLASNVSEEAAAIEDMPQSYNASVKWTATLTNQLLAQAGLGLYTQQYREIYREELPTAPGTLSAFPNGARYDPFYANFDVGTNLYRGAFRGRNVFHISGVKNWAGSLSYVTGSNTLKGGVQLQQGISREHDQHRGDMEVRFLNGAPSQVRPVRHATQRRRGNHRPRVVHRREVVARPLHDQRRPAVRLLQRNGAGSVEPARNLGAGPLDDGGREHPQVDRHQSAARPVVGPVRQRADRIEIHDRPVRRSGGCGADPDAESDAPDLVHRHADLDQRRQRQSRARPERARADQQLAIRHGGPERAHTIRPTSRASRRGRVTGTITCRSSTSCGRGWGSRAPTTSSSCSTRCCRRRAAPRSSAAGPTTCVGVPGTSTSSRSWCPTIHGCRLRSATRPITGLYVVKDASRPNVDDYRSFAKNYGEYKETYTGFDINMNWRMGNGGTLGGGMTYGNSHINDCYVVDDPTQLRFCDRNVDPNSGLVRGGLQVKLLGAYPIFGGWQLSGSFQTVRGPEITAAWTSTTFNNTIRFPNSSRTSLGATPTITVQLIEPGTMYDDRLYQVDLRGSRSFGSGARRVKLMVDLYNALNANPVLQRAAFGGVDPYSYPTAGTYNRPLGILEGRLFKIGAQLDF